MGNSSLRTHMLSLAIRLRTINKATRERFVRKRTLGLSTPRNLSCSCHVDMKRRPKTLCKILPPMTFLNQHENRGRDRGALRNVDLNSESIDRRDRHGTAGKGKMPVPLLIRVHEKKRQRWLPVDYFFLKKTGQACTERKKIVASP